MTERSFTSTTTKHKNMVQYSSSRHRKHRSIATWMVVIFSMMMDLGSADDPTVYLPSEGLLCISKCDTCPSLCVPPPPPPPPPQSPPPIIILSPPKSYVTLNQSPPPPPPPPPPPQENSYSSKSPPADEDAKKAPPPPPVESESNSYHYYYLYPSKAPSMSFHRTFLQVLLVIILISMFIC
ncbi:hypothetical protein QJS10_CPB17g00534 [Acorus calamus]|uniref:Uncharacterized protein n=1 Tax=Acorus calamus TaxID=4465 RepID=A0AAV9CXD7_ACOCL|nr:hypothetical protein QJS10_CPB17g00534 [Acorus calamus]